MTGGSQESGHSPTNESHDGGDGRVSSSDPQVTGNSDDITSVETNASSSPSDSERAAVSPADAFRSLSSSVSELSGEVFVISDFVRRCEEKLFQEAVRYRIEGMTPVLKSLMRLHGHVFRHIQATGRDKNPPGSVVAQILELVESELRNHGVETFHPVPEEKFDVARMISIGSEQPGGVLRWNIKGTKRPDHIAQVNACGFTQATDNAEKLLQKAEVTVYQKPQPEQ